MVDFPSADANACTVQTLVTEAWHGCQEGLVKYLRAVIGAGAETIRRFVICSLPPSA